MGTPNPLSASIWQYKNTGVVYVRCHKQYPNFFTSISSPIVCGWVAVDEEVGGGSGTAGGGMGSLDASIWQYKNTGVVCGVRCHKLA